MYRIFYVRLVLVGVNRPVIMYVVRSDRVKDWAMPVEQTDDDVVVMVH